MILYYFHILIQSKIIFLINNVHPYLFLIYLNFQSLFYFDYKILKIIYFFQMLIIHLTDHLMFNQYLLNYYKLINYYS